MFSKFYFQTFIFKLLFLDFFNPFFICKLYWRSMPKDISIDGPLLHVCPFVHGFARKSSPPNIRPWLRPCQCGSLIYKKRCYMNNKPWCHTNEGQWDFTFVYKITGIKRMLWLVETRVWQNHPNTKIIVEHDDQYLYFIQTFNRGQKFCCNLSLHCIALSACLKFRFPLLGIAGRGAN